MNSEACYNISKRFAKHKKLGTKITCDSNEMFGSEISRDWELISCRLGLGWEQGLTV